MAILHRLGQTDLRRTKPGMYGDGGGLWLQVTKSTAGHANRSWIFRYGRNGRRREMGLGPTYVVGLRDAREKAAALRKLVYEGVDPIDRRATERLAKATAAAKVMTFDDCARSYLRAHAVKWTPKHAEAWAVSLAKHASPAFGKVPVQDIDVALVIKALDAIWHKTPESASRLRGRIESILAWAAVRGFRSGDNPAKWTGYLQTLLPSRRELSPTKHFAALPYAEVPRLMMALSERTDTAASALRFLALTAARSKETLGARWSEIDTASKTWVVPAERMKARKAHRVPLTPQAIAVLDDMRAVRRNEFIFPGVHRDALTESPMRELLKRIGFKGTTVHGLRSSFRDWCRERTNFPRELAEQALAHTVGNQTERAYARGDMLEQRRRLMTAWAEYCSKPVGEGATVTALQSHA